MQRIQIIAYTKSIQALLNNKQAPEAQPWLHMAVTAERNYSIYVWDTRKVIFESRMSTIQFSTLSKMVLSHPNDNRKPLVGSQLKLDYFNNIDKTYKD